MKIIVEGDPHISGPVYERLSGIVHDRLRTKTLITHLAIELPDQGMGRIHHKSDIPIHDLLRLLLRERSAVFRLKTVQPALFFQLYEGSVSVIIAYPEFFPPIDSVDLLAQSPVVQIVKIKTSDMITSVLCVGISLCDCIKPRPDRKEIRPGDLMLPLMSVVNVHAHSIL